MAKSFNVLATWLLGLAILLLNFWLIYPLFTGEFSQFMQSIEVSYVTMARFIKNLAGWNPLWYLGYPLYLFYTPLLPFLEVLIHQVVPAISLARAYRLITAFSYCLVPVSLYIFVLRLSKKRSAALVAAVAFSILPSINYLVGEVRAIGDSFSLAPWRLVILTLYGEGPHTMSQVFLLLAAAAYHKLLDVRSFKWSVITAFLVALTGLTNAIGFSALVVLLLVIAFSEILFAEDKKRQTERWKISLMTAVLAYGFLAFWYNFSFIKSFFGESSGVLTNYLALFPWGIVFLGLAMGAVYVALSRLKDRGLRIVVLWFGVVAFIVVAHYQWGIDYAPQALRLMSEVDMAFAAIVGILIGGIGGREKEEKGLVFRRVFSVVVSIVVLGLVVFVSRDFLGFTSEEGQFTLRIFGRAQSRPLSKGPYSHLVTAPGPGPQQSTEYEISHWLEEHVPEGTRAYVSGNYAFWLNYFTDVPQVRGALDQSAVHPWAKHASYQIYHGESGEISIAWAKIMNVKYVVVNTLTSRNPFKDYLYPGKFNGLLEPVYEKKGDIIYEVPLKDATLAKAVDLSKHKTLAVPRNAVDEEPIFAYVDWLGCCRGLEFRKITTEHYQIEGNLGRARVFWCRQLTIRGGRLM